jgi:hypothetical protein
MEFDHQEYKASLLKILDIARESHWYVFDRVVTRQLDVAKTYLWASSVIGGVSAFLVKDLGVSITSLSGKAIILSITLAGISFLLSMLVFWGRMFGKIHAETPLLSPLSLANFSYEQMLRSNAAGSSVYAGIIASVDEAIVMQRATNTKRTAILRIAAPFLLLSFIMLIISIGLSVFNV